MQTYFNIISIIVLVKEMPINNFILGCALLISRTIKETRLIYRLFMSFYITITFIYKLFIMISYIYRLRKFLILDIGISINRLNWQFLFRILVPTYIPGQPDTHCLNTILYHWSLFNWHLFCCRENFSFCLFL